MAGKPWRKEEIDYVRNNFDKKKAHEIAEALGRTKRAVWHVYNQLGLQKKEVAIGDVFGRLTVKDKWLEKRGNQQATKCLCSCECGGESKPWASSLLTSTTVSCGCHKREAASKRIRDQNTTHDLSYHPLYRVWWSMKERCYRQKNIGYHNYGARGISVCEEWRDDFKAFYDWAISNGFTEGLTLDRIDPNGNYKPENCRWLTMKDQSNNKRTNVLITAFGETKTLALWLEDPRCNASAFSIRYRMDMGYSPEDAISLKSYSRYTRKIDDFDQSYKSNPRSRSKNRNSKLLRKWYSMKSRCYNPINISYENYGGRGIKVCEEWKNDYDAFYEWSINNNYTDGASLDRIDCNKGYCPENCRWTEDIYQQANNKRNSAIIEAFGEQKTLSEWSRDSRYCAGNKSNVVNRIKSGWKPEAAISTPALKGLSSQ